MEVKGLTLVNCVLNRVYEDGTCVPSTEFVVRPTEDGGLCAIFPDGEKYELDERGVILTTYQSITNKNKKLHEADRIFKFYLGPTINQYAKEEFDYFAFETDEDGNKEFLMATVPYLDFMFTTNGITRDIRKNNDKMDLIQSIVTNNKEFVNNLFEFYEAETVEEALEYFMYDLTKEVVPDDEDDTGLLTPTGYEVGTRKGAAILFDTSLSALVDNDPVYESISYEEGGYISVEGLRAHDNGEGHEGYWVGFALAYDTENEKKPNGIVFSVMDGGDPYATDTFNLSLQPGDDTFIGKVPEIPPVEEPQAPVYKLLGALEKYVMVEDIESNPDAEGVGVYFDATDYDEVFTKKVIWQWVYSDDKEMEVTEPEEQVFTFHVVKREEEPEEEDETPDDEQPEEKVEEVD